MTRVHVEQGVLEGNETDIAHVLLALAQGLAAQETAGWLGTSRASMDRRWKLAITGMLNGFAGLGGASRSAASRGGQDAGSLAR